MNRHLREFARRFADSLPSAVIMLAGSLVILLGASLNMGGATWGGIIVAAIGVFTVARAADGEIERARRTGAEDALKTLTSGNFRITVTHVTTEEPAE